MAAMHIYGKILKNLLLWNCLTDFNKIWSLASGTLAHYSLYKSWPWVDLDLFYGRVIIYHISFSMEKTETLDFSGSFVACDLTVGTFIQLIEFMKSYEYSMSRSSLDICQRSFYILNLKLNFLRINFTNQSQILYVVS